MNAEASLKKILLQVQKLDKVEQVTLLKKITSMLHEEEEKSELIKLSDISGVGSFLWSKVDIDQYVDEERQW
jgi:hypothetical protein